MHARRPLLRPTEPNLRSSLETSTCVRAGFFEGAQVIERGGTFYLLYSTGTTHRMVYATATQPLGPFVYRGAFLDEVWGWTTHGSAVEWWGDWFYLHHDSACSMGDTARRCVKAAHMEFADDGAIADEVAPRGLNPRRRPPVMCKEFHT